MAPKPRAFVLREPEPALLLNEGGWERAVAELRRVNPRQANALGRARFVGHVEGEARIAFAPADSIPRKEVTDSQRDIEAQLSKFFGRPIGLVLDDLKFDTARPSPAEVAASEKQKERETREKDAHDHPAVALVRELLGGDIKSISQRAPLVVIPDAPPAEDD